MTGSQRAARGTSSSAGGLGGCAASHAQETGTARACLTILAGRPWVVVTVPALVPCENTLANAAPRAMARLRVTRALWVRLETSNARSLRALTSNGTPNHRVLDAPGDQIPQQGHPLPLDLVCRRGLQVCVRGIGVAHSAADTDGPAKRRGIVEDGPALLDALLDLGRPDPPVLDRCRDGRCQPATQVPRWKALRQPQSRRACTAGHGDSVPPIPECSQMSSTMWVVPLEETDVLSGRRASRTASARRCPRRRRR